MSRVLRSGWLTSGEATVDFEQKFGEIVGAKYAVAVNSGTAALHTILSSLGLKGEDEVVVPANTFASTVNAVFYVGAKAVVADCEVDTFNVSAETVDRVITPRTQAVMVTHLAGNPCEMDPIRKLCRENNLVLIEDCAHAQGSKYRGKRVLVLKMKAARIGDLADACREFFASIYGRDAASIKITRIGAGPGEKVHEELMTDSEALTAIEARELYIIKPETERVARSDREWRLAWLMHV